MAKSINLSKYDPGLLDVLEAICTTKGTLDIPYPSEEVAKKERFEFYGLIRALKITGHSLVEQGVGDIVFSLTGPSKNVLTLTHGKPHGSSFYTRVAEEHLKKSETPGA